LLDALLSLRTLRDKASTMPDDDRRAFAASVSLAFAQLLMDDEEGGNEAVPAETEVKNVVEE
jgi:hypothetical protein